MRQKIVSKINQNNAKNCLHVCEKFDIILTDHRVCAEQRLDSAFAAHSNRSFASKLLSEAGSAEDIRLIILWKEIHA